MTDHDASDRKRVVERITSLAFDDFDLEDEPDDMPQAVPGGGEDPGVVSRSMPEAPVILAERSVDDPRKSALLHPSLVMNYGAETLPGSAGYLSAGAAKKKDSDAASIKSSKSGAALEHKKAFVTGTVNAIIGTSTKLFSRIVPTSSEGPVTDSLEVLAAFEVLPKEIRKMQMDALRNPEIMREATVSEENTISEEELKFQQDRRRFGREAFAKFIGVPPELVDEQDVPNIAVCGSGGGLKAMLGTTGYLKGMENEGLYDAVMYLSGVSGSCWTLSNLYREAVQCSPRTLAELFEATLNNFPGEPIYLQETLLVDPLVRVPLLFGGMVSKRLSGLPRGVVEVYSAFMQSHFFSTDPIWTPNDFKLSLQYRFCQGGKAPLPIHTAIRHERPWLARKDKETVAPAPGEQDVYEQHELDDMEARKNDVEQRRAWWQWFELSPLQVGCDELKVWIPTWSFGRRFKGGKSIDKVPEQSFSMIVGMVASAMTAPWQTTCETLGRTDPKSWIGSRIRNRALKMLAPDAPTTVKEVLSMHPFHSAYNWNPLFKIRPGPHPPGLINSERIQLIDAGADNNQPLYPFVRPGRNVDVIFVLDSSEDVERNIVTIDIENFGNRRGLKFTRISPDPPPQLPPKDDPAPAPKEPSAPEKKPGIFSSLISSVSTSSLTGSNKGSAPSSAPSSPTPTPAKPKPNYSERYANRYCQVFKGEPLFPPGTLGDHGEPMAERGVVLIYLPMIGNDKMPDDFSPSKFSFGKLQYLPKEVADLVRCGELNFAQEMDRIKLSLRSVWEGKRDARKELGG
ncbi:hypothetical protein HDU96_003288 [Phlyctochytrium bullatum]|nr:hypothetical protein HDU96_003288 [Phlyctochytrium bullatum]